MRLAPAVLAALLATALPGLAKQAPSKPGEPQAAQPVPSPQAIAPSSEARRISADEIDKYLAEGKTLVLDVREPKEVKDLGTIEGAVNIPLAQLEGRLAELPKDRLILTA